MGVSLSSSTERWLSLFFFLCKLHERENKLCIQTYMHSRPSSSKSELKLGEEKQSFGEKHDPTPSIVVD